MCTWSWTIAPYIVTRVKDYIQNQVIPEEERCLLNKKEKGDTEENNVCIKDENRKYKVTIHEVRVHACTCGKQHFIVWWKFIQSLLGRKLLVCLLHWEFQWDTYHMHALSHTHTCTHTCTHTYTHTHMHTHTHTHTHTCTHSVPITTGCYWVLHDSVFH